ncbi:hypothetical protein QCA50_020874 [Cerrena zonata]|uniref:RRM domain-containing protein n=1 Tax=Cerrena zonata TaxID=2478898 RepID=A0AAW0F7L6_9APHY
MAASRGDRKPYSRPAARPRASDGEWLHDRAPGAARNRTRTNNNKTDFNRDADEQANISSEPSAKLVVSNLHYEITPRDLAAVFGAKGTLVLPNTDSRSSQLHTTHFSQCLNTSNSSNLQQQTQYDRSGRSSGVAIITYETAAEASIAKQEYDGRLCKDQPMAIEFYNPAPKRMASAPSLINRIQKPALLDRLEQDRGDKNGRAPQGPGPVRNRRQPRHSTGNAPNPNTNRPPRNAPKGKRAPNKPVTAEDLDKELDNFMKEDNNVTAAPPVAAANGDVEMA